MPTPTSTAGRVAAATPTERDRFAELLRVASIVVVVAGHWLMAMVGWRGGRVEAGNAIALAPAMLGLHRRFGPAVAVGLGLAAGAADLAGRREGGGRLGG
jgi:hypothetical protein